MRNRESIATNGRRRIIWSTGRHRIFYILTALLLLTAATLLPSSAALAAEIPNLDGDTYLLASGADLGWFRDEVNNGNTKIKAKLTADINLSDASGKPAEWTPIGISFNKFEGKFDGNGHTVSGYKIVSTVYGTMNNKAAGFFGVVGSRGGSVINLTVSGDIDVSDNPAMPDYFAVGGVAAENYGTVSGCANNGNITAAGGHTAYVGGITGYSSESGWQKDCTNKGDILVKDSATGYAGGILGYYFSNSRATESCVNEGTVSAEGSTSNYAGGIAGYVHRGFQELKGCINSGETAASGGDESYAGGIAGQSFGGHILNCANEGTVSAAKAGGLVGYSANGFGGNEPAKIDASTWLKGTADRAVGEGESENTDVEMKEIPAVEISLDSKTLALKIGEKKTITATIIPANATDKKVTWDSGNTAVATVDEYGEVTAVAEGTATITVKSENGELSASCIVTVCANDSPTDISVTEKPHLPGGTNPEVTAAAAEITTVKEEATEEEKTAAVVKASEKLASVTSADVEINKTGGAAIKADAAKEAAGKIMKDGERLSAVLPLPIFTTKITEGGTVAVAFKVTGEEFGVSDPAKARILKYLDSPSKSGEWFEYASDPAAFGDRRFTILTGGADEVTHTIEVGKEYDLVVFVKDNGDYDLNKAAGIVADPVAIIKTTAAAEPGHSGGSGGCSVGLGLLSFISLAVLPAVSRKRRGK
ncbi:MAG: Ig-like domain-containing protein [Synergistaceae bacterium]|nr:Ig-like domain-containing protein [Synergistaceae bacterium]